MLKSLTVKNFRKLRDARFDFTKGLNVIRGSNEIGKSTALEAISYALFGVSACRTPLAEMVTWGEKDSTLKVELVFEVEGTTYTIKRSKSGCEVTYGAERVVGQTECGAFIGRLFGVSSKNVNRLILSGQGNIRGALSEGSAKTAELIEQLANFSIIDQIADLIQTHRTTGSAAPFEERAAALDTELVALEAALVPPDTAADEARIVSMTAETLGINAKRTATQAAIGPLVAHRDELRKLLGAKNETEGRGLQLALTVGAAEARLKTHNAAKPTLPNVEEMDKLAVAIAGYERDAERFRGKEITERIAYPEENFWEGDAASFEAEMLRCTKAAAALRQKEVELARAIATKEAEVVAAAKCGHCGQDFSKLPAAAAKNAALALALADLNEDLVLTRRALAGEEVMRQALQECLSEHQRLQGALARYGDAVKWDVSVFPHRPVWNWVPLSHLFSVEVMKDELQRLKDQERACTVWEAAWHVHMAAAERANAEYEQVKARLAEGFPGVEELPAIEGECDDLNTAYSALLAAQAALDREFVEISARVAAAKAVYDQAVARVETVRAQKADAEKLIADIGFNNALLKRVRAARPVIANKLWSMVLAAVSNYFSKMRGTESVVTKDGDGFKVDGKVIESLSGSTLDILGLAIRLALVRTFLPQTPFLILDEPSSGCDIARTEAVMSFLVSCGFDQMLLVTHESFSETVAENLIAI